MTDRDEANPGDASASSSDPSQRRDPLVRRPWVAPAVQDHGSTRRLVRGSTGPYGDQAQQGSKRPTP